VLPQPLDPARPGAILERWFKSEKFSNLDWPPLAAAQLPDKEVADPLVEPHRAQTISIELKMFERKRQIVGRQVGVQDIRLDRMRRVVRVRGPAGRIGGGKSGG
jgi:hypothetical protein